MKAFLALPVLGLFLGMAAVIFGGFLGYIAIVGNCIAFAWIYENTK